MERYHHAGNVSPLSSPGTGKAFPGCSRRKFQAEESASLEAKGAGRVYDGRGNL
ncbi:hypothetical protein LptCag_2575 [Leptospirillum ferriphilum]|uniref:Uncharacterized protein n=1 Tax=Leptospirillum ferriphilum TaxID=178606 RepID=A0A094YPH0_9BACT|nr:hypothetical protein LptCag_2575 [Leptospirillum ferriphilum]